MDTFPVIGPGDRVFLALPYDLEDDMRTKVLSQLEEMYPHVIFRFFLCETKEPRVIFVYRNYPQP